MSSWKLKLIRRLSPIASATKWPVDYHSSSNGLPTYELWSYRDGWITYTQHLWTPLAVIRKKEKTLGRSHNSNAIIDYDGQWEARKLFAKRFDIGLNVVPENESLSLNHKHTDTPSPWTTFTCTYGNGRSFMCATKQHRSFLQNKNDFRKACFTNLALVTRL